MKDEKSITITNAFQKTLKNPNRNKTKYGLINAYYSTIKMKPVDVKLSSYIDSIKEINYQDPKFKIGDIVKIWKYKNIFEKSYVPNRFEEVFVIKKG